MGWWTLALTLLASNVSHSSFTCRRNINSKPFPLPYNFTLDVKSQKVFKLTNLCHIWIREEMYKAQTGPRSITTAKNSAMPGLTAINLPAVCGVGAVICRRNARKRAIQHRYGHAATASWWTERNLNRGCRHAKEEMWKRKWQRAPKTTTATPPQDYTSRRCYATTHNSSSSLSCLQLHRPAPSDS
jgi:hypothetical protein